MSKLLLPCLILITLNSLAQTSLDFRGNPGIDQQPQAKLEGLECNIVSSFSTGNSGCWGLDWHEGYLWASLTSYPDYIFKLDTLGNHVDSIQLPNFSNNAYGDIEVFGDSLWIVQESAGALLKIDLSTDSILLETILPDNGSDENYFSVAHDGQFLYVMNYFTADNAQRLYKLNPATHVLLDSFDLLHYITILEMIGNELWCLCGAGQCFPYVLFQINTATGGYSDSSEWCITQSPYGMAWDGKYLWESEGLTHLIHKIDIGLEIGIPEDQGEMTAEIFPNPASDHITISFGSMPDLPARIQIVNMLGQIVYDEIIDVREGRVELDLTSSLQGIYMLNAKLDEREMNELVLIE